MVLLGSVLLSTVRIVFAESLARHHNIVVALAATCYNYSHRTGKSVGKLFQILSVVCLGPSFNGREGDIFLIYMVACTSRSWTMPCLFILLALP
ncbi:hypothetical protein BJ878DRAFT_276271 [Calycina marina]|uniref:Secreted protein n=1 Tax=Calycina marina TaxID=1763456 RepID=A0A9P7YVY0_9HELO|nr:hypothetical protein BJ878DRAFT_276271 [Calycina marina]